MSSRIEDLTPEARVIADRMLSALDVQGVKYYVSEPLRTLEVQRAYYAQGRRNTLEVNSLRFIAGLAPIQADGNKKTITECDGDYRPSPHQSGRAMDIYPVVQGKVRWKVAEENIGAWKILGEAGELAGFVWGGRWKPLDKLGIGWDAPHFQVKT